MSFETNKFHRGPLILVNFVLSTSLVVEIITLSKSENKIFPKKRFSSLRRCINTPALVSKEWKKMANPFPPFVQLTYRSFSPIMRYANLSSWYITAVHRSLPRQRRSLLIRNVVASECEHKPKRVNRTRISFRIRGIAAIIRAEALDRMHIHTHAPTALPIRTIRLGTGRFPRGQRVQVRPRG